MFVSQGDFRNAVAKTHLGKTDQNRPAHFRSYADAILGFDLACLGVNPSFARRPGTQELKRRFAILELDDELHTAGVWPLGWFHQRR